MPPDRAEVDQLLLSWLHTQHKASHVDSLSFGIAGISLKTQELYALVFVTRYVDLFFRYVSL